MSQLQFIEEGHIYKLGDMVLPSNTQLLKGAGLIDDRFYTDAGRERGTGVHTACWYLDEGDLDWETVPAEWVPYVEAFGQFKAQTGFKTDFNELAVWSKAGFATRLDMMGILNGRRALIDIKTGQVQKWVGLQLAGQQIAVNERIQAQDEPWTADLEYVSGHPYPEARFALRLDKTGKYKLIPFTNPADLDVFLGVVHLHHWKAAA